MKISASPLPNTPASLEGNTPPSVIDGKDEGAFANVLAGAKKATPSHKSTQPPVDETAADARPDTAVSGKNSNEPKDDSEIDAHKAKHDDRPKLEATKLEATGPLSLLMALRSLHQAPLVNPTDKSAPSAPPIDENALSEGQAATLSANAEIPVHPESAVQLLAALTPTPVSAKDGTAKTAAPGEKAGASKNFDFAPAFPTTAADQADPDMTAGIMATASKSSARNGATAAAPPQSGGQTVANRLTVVGEQNFPAPAPYQASQTASSLASSIAGDTGMRQVFAASAGLAQPGSTVALSSHTLKIELHPAELGMVTANLRLAGGQLSIELTPENHEAHRRLSADTEALVKSLRAMGFDVEKVTVLQPSIAPNAPTRADAPAMTGNAGGRDSSGFQSGNSGSDGNNSGGQQSARNRNDDSHQARQNAPQNSGRTGGDLFI